MGKLALTITYGCQSQGREARTDELSYHSGPNQVFELAQTSMYPNYYLLEFCGTIATGSLWIWTTAGYSRGVSARVQWVPVARGLEADQQLIAINIFNYSCLGKRVYFVTHYSSHNRWLCGGEVGKNGGAKCFCFLFFVFYFLMGLGGYKGRGLGNEWD